MVRWKVHGWLSLRVDWTIFTICYHSGVEAICVQLGFFTGGWPLCIQILPGQGRPPSTVIGIRKPETLDYQKVKTASLCCVPSLWHNTGVWRTDRRTDRQTDVYAVAYTALVKLALRRAVKTGPMSNSDISLILLRTDETVKWPNTAVWYITVD